MTVHRASRSRHLPCEPLHLRDLDPVAPKDKPCRSGCAHPKPTPVRPGESKRVDAPERFVGDIAAALAKRLQNGLLRTLAGQDMRREERECAAVGIHGIAKRAQWPHPRMRVGACHDRARTFQSLPLGEVSSWGTQESACTPRGRQEKAAEQQLNVACLFRCGVKVHELDPVDAKLRIEGGLDQPRAVDMPEKRGATDAVCFANDGG